MTEVDKLKAILTQHQTSITKPRLAVFETLQHADDPLKVGEIVRRTPGVNRASVYRTLDLFAELGVTTTIIRGWTPHIELAEPFKAHHHHIICQECDEAINIENDQLEALLQEIAIKHRYTLDQHTVELYGRCSACRTRTTTSS